MEAIVVNDFKKGPKYQKDYQNPVAIKGETLIKVTDASLSNFARSNATGDHYSANRELPMVIGVDGVGYLPNNKKVYFVGDGSFAQMANVENHHWVSVPENMDDAKIAGLMNPALSSWMALKFRANFKKGKSVMIIGATGTSGRLAVQIASRLGASEVIAAARNVEKLEELKKLGATKIVSTTDDKGLAEAGASVDIVLDYLWGDVSAKAMWAIIPNRKNDSQQLTWVEIGSSAGQTAPIPGAAYRAINLKMIGSGVGSVGVLNILLSFKGILKAEAKQPFDFQVRSEPLSNFESAWKEKTSDRFVFIPEK
jgi:NADPH2:quinone reductase